MSSSNKRAHDDGEDDDDDVVIVESSSAKAKKAAPKASTSKSKSKSEEESSSKEKPAKKAKKEEGDAAVKKPKPPAKPLTPQEKNSVVAKGASMARNRSIAAFLKTFADSYKEGGEYIKAAAANKAVKAILALTEPIVIARQISPLDGCGKGTIEKVEKYLEEHPEAGAEGVAQQAESEFSYLKELDRDIVLSMLQNGDVTLEAVKSQRDDINEGDF
jgi:hypothetical protein